VIYTSSGQLAAVLPSNTPTGTGTLRVSYNGNSNAASIKVVKSSPGIFAVNQQGTGPAVIQDGAGRQNALNFAFSPGQTVVIWGTGLGPISGSDANVPPTGNIPGVTVSVNIGGQDAKVSYAGRSGSAGVDQINVRLPDGVTGCYVPVYVVTAPAGGTAVTSNFGTVSITANGNTCADPNYPNISADKGYRSGVVSLSRSSSITSIAGPTMSTISESGSGVFEQYDPTYLTTAIGFSFVDVTMGSCTVIQVNGAVDSTNSPSPKILDAGPMINVNGPNGPKQMPKSQGFYSATLARNTSVSGGPAQGMYLDPGNYSLDNGAGGVDVGSFKMNLTVPPTFSWTNQNTISTVDRSQPLLITWTGGDPNARVTVSGTSLPDTSGAFIGFTCWAKDSDLQLTVPSAILSMLPPSFTIGGNSTSSLSVSTMTSTTASASGLDSLTGIVNFSNPKLGVIYK
jgi:uncharacterized protein (TIGR03437 family)